MSSIIDVGVLLFCESIDDSECLRSRDRSCVGDEDIFLIHQFVLLKGFVVTMNLLSRICNL